MGVDEALLSEVVRRVLTVTRPDRIILFGSASTGQMTRDSDIDLLVVEPEPANTRDRSVTIRRAPGDVKYPADIIVISSERFEETKNIIGGIAYLSGPVLPRWPVGFPIAGSCREQLPRAFARLLREEDSHWRGFLPGSL